MLVFVALWVILAIALGGRSSYYRRDVYGWEGGKMWADGMGDRERMPKRWMVAIVCLALAGSAAWAAYLFWILIPAWTKSP